MGAHDWHDDAACRGAETDLFFGPEDEFAGVRRKREKKARAVCRLCPVRPRCLDYAIASRQKYGLWGGLDPQQRKTEAERRGSLPPPPRPAVVVEKLCGACGVIQPRPAFGSDKTTKDGLAHWCKECTNEAARRRRSEARQAVAS